MRLVGIGLALVGTSAIAAPLLGTKPDLAANPSAPISPSGFDGPWVLFQTLVALGIVFLAIRYLLPKLATKLNRTLATPVGSEIKIEESAGFAGGALYLVSVRGKHLLLSVNGQNVSCLSEVPGPEANDAPPTFAEYLQAAPEPGPEYGPATPVDDVALALERLSRLRPDSKES